MKMNILLLTLFPWCAVWFGMYCLHNLIATFALYHLFCLLPAIVVKRKLWRGHLTTPSAKDLLVLLLAAFLSSAVAVSIYMICGDGLINRTDVLSSLEHRGFNPHWLPALTVYFITINPIFEELFWRGVIYNELKNNQTNDAIADKGVKQLSQGSTGKCEIIAAILFAAWHYVPLSTLLTTPMTFLVLAGIAGAGFLLTRCYEHSRSLTIPILWHALVLDLPLMIILHLMLLRQIF